MATETLPAKEAQAETDTKAAPAAAAKDGDETAKLISDVKAGKVKMGDILSKETRHKVMAALETEGDSEPEAKPAETTEEKPEKKGKAKEHSTDKEPSVKELEERKTRARDEQKRLADEANALEQKAKAAKERRDRAKADLDAATKAEIKLPEELLSEEAQTNLIRDVALLKQRNAALEKIVLDRDDAEAKEHETSRARVAEALQFHELDEVQAEFPSLRLSESFQSANSKYGSWLSEIETASGLKEKNPSMDAGEIRNQAVEMWNSDPEFQKKIKNKPPENMDKVMILLTAYNKKQAAGGSVMGHLLEDFNKRGVLKSMLQRVAQDSAADAAARTAKALSSDEITTLTPGDGTGKGYSDKSGMTPEKAKQVINQANQRQNAGHVLTREERAGLREAMAYLTTA